MKEFNALFKFGEKSVLMKSMRHAWYLEGESGTWWFSLPRTYFESNFDYSSYLDNQDMMQAEIEKFLLARSTVQPSQTAPSGRRL